VALPDFFVVGAPKAGTTALHRALARHPQLYVSPIKEPKFFLCDGSRPHYIGPGDAHSSREWIWDRRDYEQLFDGARPGTLRGESTPLYLADFAAHERIHRAAPEARLIAVLRDPVDRAYSNWAHLWTDGLETIGDFVDACSEEERRRAASWGPFWSYLGTGLYGSQIEHLLTLFRREQVLLIRYKWLVDEPVRTLDEVARFLGVEEGLVTDVPAHNVGNYVAPSLANRVARNVFRGGAAIGGFFPPRLWRKVSVPLQLAMQARPQHRPELPQSQRAMLVQFFEKDTHLLESITGWDLTDWLTYRDGGTYSVRKSWAPSRRVVS
jgi:hypothetical protein